MNTMKTILTETDTFNALKRIPFRQMHTLWRARALANGYPGGHPANFYTQHGWTDMEFWDTYRAYNFNV
jgi:hypothetical protein